MENINIDSGVKNIMVNDDPSRVITFNPSDVNFAERFYKLMAEMKEKSVDYQKRADQLDSEIENVDEFGLPVKIGQSVELMREICEYMKESIDKVFGAGTSLAAFGDAISLEMFDQFFNGLMPFIQKSRENKIGKYAKKQGRVM